MEDQAVNREIQEAASEGTSQEETCREHEDEYSFWCESCDIPACRKCLTLEHQGCKFVLIEDKPKLRDQQEANLLLLKKKVERYWKDWTINEENLAAVRFLLEKLQSVEIKMLDYQTYVKAWITEAQKLLSNPFKSPSALSKVPELQDSEQKKLPDLEELESKIRSCPSSLLVHMAATYQISDEDVDAFVAALQSRVEARQTDGSSGNNALAVEGSKQSFLESVAALTEGEVWVVSDATSAAAVKSVLKTTSVRPAKVEIVSNNIPDEFLCELKTLFDHVKAYPVEVSETLPSFLDSLAPCSETRASSTARLVAWMTPASCVGGEKCVPSNALLNAWMTPASRRVDGEKCVPSTTGLYAWMTPASQRVGGEKCVPSTTRLDAWMTPASWCSLTQFWGHLDAAAVQKLPATIKSVGLVLRDQEDMAAVNALYGAAFGSKAAGNVPNRSCLKWCDWTDLNLSVAKTFKAEYWRLTWLWVIYNGYNSSSTSLTLSTALPGIGVRLRLYLPQVVPGDRMWIGDLFRMTGLNGGCFSDPIPLLLPGTRIDLDSLLGVLRDSGQRWEVHLPASMLQQVAREQVVERYTEFSHCVTWDL